METRWPLILSLDTATSCSTVALTRGTVMEGEVLASLSLSTVTHSRKILTTIDWIFSETNTGWSDLGGIAVGLGPGSFTGLRIGMATAKGLAATADLPLIGVSTLDGLAAGIVTDKCVCSILDARKKELYAAFYHPDSKSIPRRIGDIVAIKPEDLVKEIVEETIMVGDGVIAYEEFWKGHPVNFLTFAPSHLHNPIAASLGLLAGEQLAINDTLDLDSAVPLYVRASDAELSLVAMKKSE